MVNHEPAKSKKYILFNYGGLSAAARSTALKAVGTPKTCLEIDTASPLPFIRTYIPMVEKRVLETRCCKFKSYYVHHSHI